MKALVSNKEMQKRLPCSRSDEVSGSKKQNRNIIPISLGYYCLQSRHVAHTDDTKTIQSCRYINQKMIRQYALGGELTCNLWVYAELQKLVMSDVQSFSWARAIELGARNLSLFCSETFIHALHEFMGFVPKQRSESGTETTFVEDTIVTITRLDAFVATSVTCFREDGTYTAGRHRPKLHNYRVSKFLASAYDQLISCIRMFAKWWCLEELSIFKLSTSGGFSWCRTSRSSRMEILIPSLKNRLMVLSRRCFKDCVFTQSSAINDRFIADYVNRTKNQHFLGCIENTGNVPGLQYIDDGKSVAFAISMTNAMVIVFIVESVKDTQ